MMISCFVHDDFMGVNAKGFHKCWVHWESQPKTPLVQKMLDLWDMWRRLENHLPKPMKIGFHGEIVILETVEQGDLSPFYGFSKHG